MTYSGPTKKWIFVIDTNQYAGNFERQLCAYLTGCVGECEVGAEYGATLPLPLKEAFSEIVDYVSDEHGCARPATVWTTPGLYNDGLGNIEKGDGTNKFPAFCSVGIYFYKKPNAAMLNLMMTRALQFDEARKELDKWQSKTPITITNFRLIEETTTQEEIPLK